MMSYRGGGTVQYLSRVRVRPLARSEYSRVKASTRSDSLLASTRISSHSQALATRNLRVLASQKAQTICTNMKRIIHLNEIKCHSYMKPSMVEHIFFEQSS
jgi:hypothetical protein